MTANIKVEPKMNSVIKENSVAKQERQQPLPAFLLLAARFFVEGASDVLSSFSFSSLIGPFFPHIAFGLAFLVAAIVPSKAAVAVEEELLMLNVPEPDLVCWHGSCVRAGLPNGCSSLMSMLAALL